MTMVFVIVSHLNIDALPAEQRFYRNYGRRGRGISRDRAHRGGKIRYQGSRGPGGPYASDQEPQSRVPLATNNEELWPSLPPAKSKTSEQWSRCTTCDGKERFCQSGRFTSHYSRVSISRNTYSIIPNPHAIFPQCKISPLLRHLELIAPFVP